MSFWAELERYERGLTPYPPAPAEMPEPESTVTGPRKFYRTTVTFVILSENYPVRDDLDKLSYDTDMGDCVLHSSAVTAAEEVDSRQMATLLIESGSDTEFFQLDEEGNDIDED